MASVIKVSVRALAEFALEGGDLWVTGQAVTRMQDGIRGHQAVQSAYGEHFQREVPIRLDFERAGISFSLFGRMDGLGAHLGDPLIEEIKTTVLSPDTIGADDYPVHWAQAMIYAHMLLENEGGSRAQVRLTYYNLSGGKASFTRSFTREALRAKFEEWLSPYVQWTRSLLSDRARMEPSLASLPFPFDRFRSGQRTFAAHGYVALRDQKNLLCQAPTGIGKTAAALFPALKAMGAGLVDAVFYLTARTTTRLAAQNALEKMRDRGLILRSVTLTARDKICACKGCRCRPDECERARGYYDRRRAALYEALDMERLDRPDIEALAEKHALCPFELSLDLSEIAQVVICDYNYAFDPWVKLRRYFMDKGNYALLVDEAHNLPDRAREMYSAQLDETALRELRREVGKALGRKAPLYRCLSGLIRSLGEYLKPLEQPAALSEKPEGLIKAAGRFVEEARPLLESAGPLGEPVNLAILEALCFNRVGEDFAPERYQVMCGQNKVKLWCYDPSGYLRECLSKVRGSVLFSATLSPMRYYADLCGLDLEKGDALLSLPSPFPPENLLVMRLPLSTRFKDRERSLNDVAGAILGLVRGKKGNYLACFPSHAYMRALVERLGEDLGDIRLLVQQNEMDDAARDAFLGEFKPDPEDSLLGCVVMGGVFSEGIDLPGDRLSGAAIIGVGLPQLCPELDTLRAQYAGRGLDGFRYAYQYPGLCRILQAAGRVIRTETDRGALLLLDDRYFRPDYEALFPPHWRVESVRTVSDMEGRLRRFWQNPNSLKGA